METRPVGDARAVVVVLDVREAGTHSPQSLRGRLLDWLLLKSPRRGQNVDADVEAMGWRPPLESAEGAR